MSERREKCETCRYWEPKELDPNEATFGPYQQAEGRACKLWPVLVYKKSQDWCGQWQRKKG